MAFEDLAGFIRPGFDLPVLGASYYVPAPSAKDGLWLQAGIDAGETLIVSGAIAKANSHVLADDDQERTMYEISLGSAYGEMVAAGVPWPVLKHAGMTAILYWTRGQKMAEAYWVRFGDGQGEAVTQPKQPETAGSPTETSTTPPA